MNNLKLMKTENFENTIPCDFWAYVNGEYFVTREQIGTALCYSNPETAIIKIHSRHKDRLDKYSIYTKLVRVEGGRCVERERTLYSRRGIMEICRWSNKPLADKFMDWCWEVIDNLIQKNDKYDSAIHKNQVTVSISMVEELLKQNRELDKKIARLENMVSTLMPPTRHSEWKNRVGMKIKNIASQFGLATDKEIKSVYAKIYNIMRIDYGLDVNSFKGDYLKTHADAVNPSAIDVVEHYDELKLLFENIVDNYMEIFK